MQNNFLWLKCILFREISVFLSSLIPFNKVFSHHCFQSFSNNLWTLFIKDAFHSYLAYVKNICKLLTPLLGNMDANSDGLNIFLLNQKGYKSNILKAWQANLRSVFQCILFKSQNVLQQNVITRWWWWFILETCLILKPWRKTKLAQ